MRKLFSYSFCNRSVGWMFWFRIFGRGMHFTNLAPLFGERHGFTKTFRVFGVKIEYLSKARGKAAS